MALDANQKMFSEDIVNSIVQKVLMVEGKQLTESQLMDLRRNLTVTLHQYDITTSMDKQEILEAQEENAFVLRDFVNAKRIEGRSNATLYNYGKEVTKMFLAINKSYRHITATDIRDYLAWRKQSSDLASVTVSNIRMYLRSFFGWLYKEELINRNPMDRIGVIKVEQHVIQTLTDEEQEIIRCACTNERDLAIIDLLSGSGMRVSELCSLDIKDVDFDKKEVKVMGKGSKERICFLTGKAKIHLMWYLENRTDDNPALFVTTRAPYNRITKAGVEYVLRQIAKNSKIPSIRLHPHKYRSTLATNMINKGAPAEHVQGILGHSSVDTTLKCYCKIDKESYKRTHTQYS